MQRTEPASIQARIVCRNHPSFCSHYREPPSRLQYHLHMLGRGAAKIFFHPTHGCCLLHSLVVNSTKDTHFPYQRKRFDFSGEQFRRFQYQQDRIRSWVCLADGWHNGEQQVQDVLRILLRSPQAAVDRRSPLLCPWHPLRRLLRRRRCRARGN